MTLRLSTCFVVVLACASGGCGGCGDDDTLPDAHISPNRTLSVLGRDSIGLAFGGQVTLRVLYAEPDGTPLANHEIEFTMVAGAGEDPRGSTLSANTALTDALGVAQVDMSAGSERTNFRVEANAKSAAARFYIAVSEDGFADIQVTPSHSGWRALEDFARVELRLFTSAELRCIDLDIDAAPSSVFSPHSLAGFSGDVTFENVSAGAPYTLIAWAEVGGTGTRVAAGCVDLGAQQVPASPVAVELVVSDRPARLPPTLLLDSTIDLTPVAAAIEPPATPWSTLGCAEAGLGQLILDCTIDALAPDGALDCVVTSEAELVTTLEARRGPPSSDGCRPAVVATDPSLDSRLHDAVIAGATFPTGTELESLLTIREDAIDELSLTSAIGFYGPDSGHHALHQLAVDIAGEERLVELRASDRPILEQTQVGIAYDPAGTIEIAAHGFTLSYGRSAAELFRELALEPAGLGERDLDLGAALFESAHDEVTGAGCAAISAIICAELGGESDCAGAACAAASESVDSLLAAWWRNLDGTGLDLILSGSAPLYDFDDDLAIDTIGVDGGEVRTGSWSARFILADEREVETSAIFGSTGTPEPTAGRRSQGQ